MHPTPSCLFLNHYDPFSFVYSKPIRVGTSCPDYPASLIEEDILEI